MYMINKTLKKWSLEHLEYPGGHPSKMTMFTSLLANYLKVNKKKLYMRCRKFVFSVKKTVLLSKCVFYEITCTNLLRDYIVRKWNSIKKNRKNRNYSFKIYDDDDIDLFK